MIKQKLVVLDLFAGAGGLSQGFHWAGFQTGTAIDHSELAVETIQANFPDTLALVRDLATFTPSALETLLHREGRPSDFDVVMGGPPCQGWSSVGRGKLRSLRSGRDKHYDDPRNELYKNFLRHVRYFRPAVALMENVPGMLSHNGKNIADGVAESLSDIGYEVTWDRLNASDLGVPQSRERLIFVGVRKDMGKRFRFPATRTSTGKRLYPVVTVRDAIGDLPVIRNGSREWMRPYEAGSRKISVYARLMRRRAEKETVFDHVCRNQNRQDVEAFNTMRQGGRYVELPSRFKRYRDDIFKDKYKKLRWNMPSWTVTAHLSKDCYTHIHPSQARTISVREAARLQSFPDCFYFAGNMGSKFQLIGNAVPPLMAMRIADEIRKQIFEDGKQRHESGHPETLNKSAALAI